MRHCEAMRPGAMLLLWIILVLAVAGAVAVEGRRITSTAPPLAPARAAPTPSTPSGYRWYWFRSQWQPPEVPPP